VLAGVAIDAQSKSEKLTSLALTLGHWRQAG
jgi:hypothetical protein